MTSSKRKLAKAVTWRAVGFVSLTVLSYAITKSFGVSINISALHMVVQIGLYYAHEHAWDRCRWGKLPGLAVQLTGLSGSGKSTIATALKRRLEAKGLDVEVIDGDEYRANLCADLGFSREDRVENIRRLAFVAHKLAGVGRVAIVAAINPYDESRQHLKMLDARHMTVFVDADLDTVVRRDTKGLYRRAMLPLGSDGHVPNFTGISDPYERPKDPDLTVDTARNTAEKVVSEIERAVLARLGGDVL